MDPGPFLDRVLDDEGLTRDLDEAEAMALLATVAERVRKLAAGTADAHALRGQIEELCRRARAVAGRVARSSTPAATLKSLIEDL